MTYSREDIYIGNTHYTLFVGQKLLYVWEETDEWDSDWNEPIMEKRLLLHGDLNACREYLAERNAEYLESLL